MGLIMYIIYFTIFYFIYRFLRSENIESEDTVSPRENSIRTDSMPSLHQENSLNAFEVLRNDLENMYNNKIQTDLKIKIETKAFHVHKCILSARSPVFQRMLTQDMMENRTGVVNITDMDAKIFGIFLKYLYTGSFCQLDCESALNLMLVAEKYQVYSLKKNCSDYLIPILSKDNVCDILNIADMVSESSLKLSAMDYVKSHADKVLISDGWKKLVKNNATLVSETLSKLSKDFRATAIGKKDTERESKSTISEFTSQQFSTVSENQTSNRSASKSTISEFTSQQLPTVSVNQTSTSRAPELIVETIINTGQTEPSIKCYQCKRMIPAKKFFFDVTICRGCYYNERKIDLEALKGLIRKKEKKERQERKKTTF